MLKTIRKGNWLEIIIPKKWNGKTMEDIFRNEWEVPRKLTHTFRTEKKVLLNGNPANWNVPLAAEERILINLFDEQELEVPSSYQEIDILFEDDHVIVFNKPPFMSTHPNDHTDQNTLLNAALFYLESKGETRYIRHIHRLDKDTSGAILFTKHSLAGAILDRKLANREIKRTYLAVVHGKLKAKKGTIHVPIGRDRHHPTRRRASQTGQDAITHYQLLRGEQNRSYIKCWLETGRTHQIRVHFSHIGHPLIGDVLYGGDPVLNRQALHAAKLEFVHPITEEKIICFAPFVDEPPIFSNIDFYSL